MDLNAYLADCNQRYSSEHHMLGTIWQGPGYHTRIPNGTWAHPTRESLDYALGLLRSGEPAHAERAALIIRKALTLQDTDPTSHTYGIWPWLLEEPLPEMAPPDWNWADFCGARLAQMLVEHAETLPADLIQLMRESLGHAAWSIFRRNVRPGYTNIAIMGAGVTLMTGELLDEGRLVAYGRRRLANIVAHTTYHGGFNEYNSPTYTIVAVHECERILQLVQDPAGRAEAEKLRQLAWEMIAGHFHPATQQWAGPHSRAYSDRLRAGTTRYLSEATGLTIQPHPTIEQTYKDGLTHLQHLPCPTHLIDRFRALPETSLILRQRFIRRDTDARTTWGTTWFTEAACLGSINYDSMWVQRRGLIGYWKTDDDPAVVLRLRFLHDGQDFAAAGVRNAQQSNRVLSAITMLTNKGDHHLHLDRPSDGLFEAEDFRARYELVGADVKARQLDELRFELAAGNHRAVIQTAPGLFGPSEITWELGREEDRVYLDAVCYRGKRQAFNLATLGQVVLTAGLELLEADQPASQTPLLEHHWPDNRLEISWPIDEALCLGIPLHAEAYWD